VPTARRRRRSSSSHQATFWDNVRYQIDLRWPPSRTAVGLTLAAAVGLVLVVFAFQVMSARSTLNRAADQADLLQTQIVAGQVDAAKATLSDLQASADDAHQATGGFLWRLGAKIPWLGRNVDAIRIVSTELDRVSDRALPPIVDLTGELSAKSFSPQGGTVDIAAIGSASSDLAASSQALEISRKALDRIDIAGLLAPLRAPVATVQDKIGSASAVAQNAVVAADLLPDMLGGDGTRRYLLLMQNNAESRPTGGIAGSFAVIKAKKGKVSLVEQGSAPDLPPFPDPVAKLTKDERGVFPSTMASDLRDVNTTPDFPRSAAIAKKLYERKFGTEIDGVVTIDPVALSYLLQGLGSVKIKDNLELDSASVVPALLHQVYRVYNDRAIQDDFFHLVTEKVFDSFRSGEGDPVLTLRGLVRAVEENRIALWSDHQEEQKALAPTDLSGAYPDDTGGVPRVGVFLSDAASTKMEYFLTQSTTVAPQNCLARGRQVLAITTQLGSSAPFDGLPVTITGSGDYVKKGSMRLNVRLISPTGGQFTSVRVDGKPVTVNADRWHDRNVTRLEVLLKPGASHTITANVTSGEGQTAGAQVTTTPGVTAQRNDYQIASACSS